MNSAEVDRFREEFDVSRETSDRMSTYAALLLKWNARINLVSRRSADELWERHIRDSAQLMDHCPENAKMWLDMGSGGGLPALVVAVLAAEKRPSLRFALIESDERKAAFLQTVVRQLDLPADVNVERIEDLPPIGADVISARALAPLVDLLAYAERHARDNAICLFPKGRNHEAELTDAKRKWHLECTAIRSRTDPDAVILKIGEFSRV